IPIHAECSARGAKEDAAARWLQSLHDNGRASERRMTTERHLNIWSEPAQPVFGPVKDEKSGLGKVVLGRDGLHLSVGRKLRQWNYRCRVTREQAGRESVDLKN